MRKTLVTLCFFSLALTSATSSVAGSPPSQERQAILEQIKSIEMLSHEGRIAILNEANECVKIAKNRNEYQACERKEKADREALSAEIKAKRKALREHIQALRAAS